MPIHPDPSALTCCQLAHLPAAVATFPVGQTAIAFQPQLAEDPMLPITLAQMREAIDLATLEQVLDDF